MPNKIANFVPAKLNICPTLRAKQKESGSPILDTFTQFTEPERLNNGRFDINLALANYMKGFISPTASMLLSYGRLISAGDLSMTMSLTIATSLAMLPMFSALNATKGLLSTLQIGAKILKAQNSDEMEKAFYDLGVATSSMGLPSARALSKMPKTKCKIADSAKTNLLSDLISFKKPKIFMEENNQTQDTTLARI